MYKIGDFSKLGKVTIKTLRYYEKVGLLIPKYIDKNNSYRFYETNQLLSLMHIISLRQVGMKISDIKKVLEGNSFDEMILKRQKEIEKEISILSLELQRINYLRKGDNMKYEVIIKELPDYTIYYKEGTIKDFSQLTNFILGSGSECLNLNPNLKCLEPDYCYVNYLDNEFKDHDLKVRYCQAVCKEGIENENIKFKKLKRTEAACIYHKGSYTNLRDTYSYILKWISDNHYEITESIRERYIDGMWNKENEEEWLTEIQVPIKRA